LAAACARLEALAAGDAPQAEPYPLELDPEAPRERFRDRAGVPFVPALDGADEDEDADEAGDPPPPPPPADASKLTGLSPGQQTLYRVAHTLYGEQLLRARRVEDAAVAFQATLDGWPDDPRAAAGKARALAAQGQRAEALSQLESAIAAHPADADLLLVQGQVRYLEGDAKGAASALAAAVQAAGAEGTLSFRAANTALGLSLLLAGELTEAEAALLAADSAPGFAPARLGRGLVAEFRGDPDAARTHYEEAARLDPHDAEAHYALAQLHLAAEDFEAAEVALRAALAEGYVLELGVTSLVEVAHARHDPATATQLLELLYRVEERPDPRLLSALGNAYLGHDRVEDAEGLFRQALTQDPGHLQSLRGLAYCAYAQGQLPEARELFERLLENGRVDAWATAGLDALARQAERRVWSDGFAGSSLQTLWKRDADFGLRVEAEDGRAVFRGSQSNDAQGITSLMRRVDGELVVQVEATFTLPAGGYRAGVRFESERGGAVVFRDFDGVIRYALSDGRRGWDNPVDLGTWPADGAHRLAIDLSDPAKGLTRFLLDGKPLGEVEVSGLRVAGRKVTSVPVRVGIYGRGQALGQRVEFRCDEVKVFVEREPAGGPKPPKKY
ncbi:MAG: tetratricopeptide repeat protein, partial [Planctomycetes bacterium]|nr:tetratricopeptide repeat protein [Planctomycetota bacterium]